MEVIDSVMGYMIEWGSIPDWVVAVAAISLGGYGYWWARKVYKRNWEDRAYLTVSHDTSAVSIPASDEYFLMITFEVHNPSKVPATIGEISVRIWDVYAPSIEQLVCDYIETSREWEWEIVVGPGATLYLSRSIEMELPRKVLKVEAFVGIEGRAGGYGQGSLFEFHPKEERNGKGQ